MKKFLLLLFVISSFSVLAQEENLDCDNTSKIIKNDIRSDKSAVVIWSEDFGGGFPSGWSTYTNNTGAGNNGVPAAGNTATCPWKHSTNGSWGYWNSVGTNTQGNPTGPASPISSTTAANGFLISDPDSANHWNGNPGSSSGSTYHYLESYFTTSAIDLTGWPNVSLEFEHNFRFNNSIDLVVSVSSDSMNWIHYNIQGNATNNQASADPEYLSLNISSVAGNQGTVYVKVGWTARVYYWMIDDMKIVETPDNRLSLVDAENGGWWVGYLTAGGLGMEYAYSPLKQAIANPYTFEGIVTNAGALTQTSRMNVEVFDGIGSSVFSTTSADSVITPQDTVTFIGNSTFVPSSVGQYYSQTWASSLDTISDTIMKDFIVTDNLYARDIDNDYSWYGLGRSCGGMVIGAYYDIYDTDYLESISVFIQGNWKSSGVIKPTTIPGSEIFVSLYEIDASNAKVYLEQSDDYEILASDTNNWVTIEFDSPIEVYSGTTYMASVGGYANPVDTSAIGMSQYTYPSTCYIQKNGCLTGSQTFGSWYWTSRVPMIRMNFSTGPTMTQDIFDGSISVFPNPNSGSLTLDMIDVKSGHYTMSIMNILGEEIYVESREINGTSSTIMDLNHLSKGTYILKITNNEDVLTDKIIIQ